MVAQYRMLLAEKGLPSEGLSDDVIETFASTACVFATAADTPDDFETFRQLAVQETQSVLSPEGRILTIDAAVVTFCPAEAERLGISV
jgi:hypothetical protein